MEPKVMLLAMAAVLLSFANVSAQEQHSRQGGLFGENTSNISNGLMDRNRSTIGGDLNGQTFGFGATNGNITGQTFGNDTPLDGGLFVLLAAGVGYAKLKTKKTQKQNRKEK